MAQPLRTFTTLVENLGSVSSTHSSSQLRVKLQGIRCLSGISGHLYTHGAHTHTQAHTHSDISFVF